MIAIDGVTFTTELGLEEQGVLVVASVSPESKALEFIIEAGDDSWATDVLALKVGATVAVPKTSTRAELRLRLFDVFGREINRGSGRFSSNLEVSEKILPATRKTSNSVVGFGTFLVVGVSSLLFFLTTSWSDGPKIGTVSQTTSNAEPDLAVLARAANLRSSPTLTKGNVLLTLPFGTLLWSGSQSGEFVKVRVLGGQNGYIHRDVVGDSRRVIELGLTDSLILARAVPDNRRGAILAAARDRSPSLFNSTLLSDPASSRIDEQFQSAISQTMGDSVSSCFFHYLAEDAAKLRNFEAAVIYFRAAAFSDPLSARDVHGWGLTQLRATGTVDETAVLHSAVVAPRSTNTWLLVAGYLANRNAESGQQEATAALRVAVGLSMDLEVTKRFISDLESSMLNANFKRALIEIKTAI